MLKQLHMTFFQKNQLIMKKALKFIHLDDEDWDEDLDLNIEIYKER